MPYGQAERGERFKALHHGPGVLVLGSVWDAASAVVFEREGFAALGTSSAGMAYARGLPDGEAIALGDLISAVKILTEAVAVPVSVDLETGFGKSPEEIAQSCLLALEAGAVGINLEDAPTGGAASLFDIDRQCAVIRTVRQAAQAKGLSCFINARTDSYWLGLWDEPRRLKESIARGNAYLAAGADGVFVPGALERATIARLVGSIRGPINILAMPGCPDVTSLAELGVRRVSQGSGPARAMLGLARRVARELLDQGCYGSFHQGAIPYADANRLFDRG